MASSNKTALGLNQWGHGDKPNMEDFNQDNQIIESKFANVDVDISDIKESLEKTVRNPQVLYGDVDLNTFTAPGVYYHGGGRTPTFLNAPKTNELSFSLVILKTGADNQSGIIQVYTTYLAKVYIRYYNSQGWGAWKTIIA